MYSDSLGSARHLALEGTYNLRDAGGYPTREGGRVRWRTLFRSDSLDRLSRVGQETLLAHGLRTVVDLRQTQDLESAPSVFAASDVVCYRHHPLFESQPDDQSNADELPRSLEDLYRDMLDMHHVRFGTLFDFLAASGRFPVVVNCVAGKDRTGLTGGDLDGVEGEVVEDRG
jgi:protein-tyrosine phosphatase